MNASQPICGRLKASININGAKKKNKKKKQDTDTRTYCWASVFRLISYHRRAYAVIERINENLVSVHEQRLPHNSKMVALTSHWKELNRG